MLQLHHYCVIQESDLSIDRDFPSGVTFQSSVLQTEDDLEQARLSRQSALSQTLTLLQDRLAAA